MSDWAEITLKSGIKVRVEVEGLADIIAGTPFRIAVDSRGTLWAAPYADIDDGPEDSSTVRHSVEERYRWRRATGLAAHLAAGLDAVHIAARDRRVAAEWEERDRHFTRVVMRRGTGDTPLDAEVRDMVARGIMPMPLND